MHNEAENGHTASHIDIFQIRDIHGVQSSIHIPVINWKVYSTKERFASQNIFFTSYKMSRNFEQGHE
jgi:hypothetical protein